MKNTREGIGRKLMAVLAAGALFGSFLLGQTQANAAASWNGAQPSTYSGGDIFTVSGDTVTVTAAATPTFLNVNGAGSQQLLGISGIWIVNSSGNTIAGVSSTSTGGNVSTPGSSTGWQSESGPAGYGGTNGYPPGGTWIDLVSSSTLSTYGKTPSDYTIGTFYFPGLSSLSGYDFGVDYLITAGAGNTNTGRAYFQETPLTVTPEPSSIISLAIAFVALAGLLFVARRRTAAVVLDGPRGD